MNPRDSKLSNVLPIFGHTVPILEARPEHSEATAEEIASFNPVDDWCLLRVDDVFAASGLVAPENLTAKNHQRGVVLRFGPDADLHLYGTPAIDEESDGPIPGTRVQWRGNAHFEPVKLGEELLMCVRARDFIAVLS